MKVFLKPHPTTPAGPVISMRAYAERKGSQWLALTFIVAGDMECIAWPGKSRSGHEGWQSADGLWEHTCFELFGRVEGSPAYYELNFATSGEWATYAFNDYRQGMRTVEEIGLEVGRWFVSERRAKIEAVVKVPEEFATSEWQIGMSVVIEEKSGAKSYWALHHADPEKPDFHDPACFIATLPAPEAS